MTFKRTLNNPQWLAEHADELRAIFPCRWVCICTIKANARLIIASLNQLGVKIRSCADATDAVCVLINRHILEHVPSAQGDIHQHGYFRVKPHGPDNDVELVMTA